MEIPVASFWARQRKQVPRRFVWVNDPVRHGWVSDSRSPNGAQQGSPGQRPGLGAERFAALSGRNSTHIDLTGPCLALSGLMPIDVAPPRAVPWAMQFVPFRAETIRSTTGSAPSARGRL